MINILKLLLLLKFIDFFLQISKIPYALNFLVRSWSDTFWKSDPDQIRKVSDPHPCQCACIWYNRHFQYKPLWHWCSLPFFFPGFSSTCPHFYLSTASFLSILEVSCFFTTTCKTTYFSTRITSCLQDHLLVHTDNYPPTWTPTKLSGCPPLFLLSSSNYGNSFLPIRLTVCQWWAKLQF